MKKSLTICLSLLLLPPAALAFNPRDSVFSVSLGNRLITIGDRTGSNLNLLGDGKGATALGTTIALAHSTPIAIVEASAIFPFGKKDYAIKFALEAQASNGDKHRLYDGVSKTATVTMHSLPGLDTDNSGPVFAVDETIGRHGISSIATGKREATVIHKPSYGGKLLYTLGEDNNHIGIGLGVLLTKDEYRYAVEEPPVAAASSGLVESSEASSSTPTFPNAFESAVVERAGGATTVWASSSRITGTYTPVLGTEAKYNDRKAWFGIAAESCSAYDESFTLKAGLSYYMTDFSISKKPEVYAPFVVKTTDATMFIAHIGMSYKREGSYYY